MPPVHLPNAANVFLRLAVVIGTYIALHVSMRKPNPPPSKVNRKQASRIENASTAMLRPFTVVPYFLKSSSAFEPDRAL